MRRDTKLLMGAAVVAALMMGGFLAFLARAEPAADRGWGLRERWAGHRGERLAPWQQLELSTEQRTQIRAILKAHEPALQPLRRQLLAERRAMDELIAAETIDEAAIRAQAAKLAKIGADLAVERAKVAHAISQVLTPAQRAKLKELRAARADRVDKFMDRIAKRRAAD